MELLLQEVAAGVADFCELEKIGGRKERLDVVLTHFDGPGVDEGEKKLDG